MVAARGINQLLKRTLHNQSAARCLKVGDKPLLRVSIFMQWEALALLLIGISVNQLKSLLEGSSALGLPVAAGAYLYKLFFFQVSGFQPFCSWNFNSNHIYASGNLQPMLYVPGAPLGSTMIPMVLPDGRLVYIPQPAGQQPVPMTSPPPQKGGRHNGGSGGGGSSSGRRRQRGDESGSSNNNSRRGRHRPY